MRGRKPALETTRIDQLLHGGVAGNEIPSRGGRHAGVGKGAARENPALVVQGGSA
jgi:hypothetical protein